MSFFIVNHSNHGGAPMMGLAVKNVCSDIKIKTKTIISEIRTNIFVNYSSDYNNIIKYFEAKFLDLGFNPDKDSIIANSIESAIYVNLFKKHNSKKILYIHELEEMMYNSLATGRFSWQWIDDLDQVWFACKRSMKVFENQSPQNAHKYFLIEPFSRLSSLSSKAKKQSKEILSKQIKSKGIKLNNKGLIIGGCGSFTVRKGIDRFIKVAEMNPDMTFWWAGNLDKSAMDPRVVEILQQADTLSNVIFFRELPNLHAYLKSINLFIHCSYEDPNPITGWECLDLKVPQICFSYDLGEVNHILKGGLVCAGNFSAELASSSLKILSLCNFNFETARTFKHLKKDVEHAINLL